MKEEEKGINRLGVPTAWLVHTGMYPFCRYSTRRYLACFLFQNVLKEIMYHS